ncbi:AAA family ATPase [Amycolatopsis sp. OK19-0408]|uniref:AAA family ATPase n=1 Tax=Amycolatopsis iheyensis TaxID=2945988 RepID=A0A9X2NLZ0_9PSEU|nr:UvrD-helicase domain-containing protein [Amycolatopsis iheyensis]MCR6490041.1 AAA family ATPase [Amycolatopsis iheyensis]
MRQQTASALVKDYFPELDPDRRRVLGGLLAETTTARHLFVRADLAADRPQADVFLIGAEGVFAITIAAEPPRPPSLHQLVRHAEERCAGIRDHRGRVLPSSAVHFVLLAPGPAPRAARAAGPFRVIAEPQLSRLFERGSPHLDRRQVEAVGEQAGKLLAGYLPLRVQAPGRDRAADALLDPDTLVAGEVAAAQLRPFDTWLTFLHPHQRAIVNRDYSGPARISGPAGTGKTVVALHRLRRLARRSTGPLLFTTFVRTLPAVHEAAFRRLAPELAERAEFLHLHAWIRRFLADRGRGVDVDARGVRTAFSRAWGRHRAVLEPIERHDEYWRTEIDRVIRGRGFTSLAEYSVPRRRGRTVRLSAEQKAAVWRLYETYREMLAERGLHDYNDLIDLALAELRRQPLEDRYAAVVVDEVQDITLNGLRLIRELAGTGPNQLLLVGDGQQQVYPGGWRLSDAGIPIQGRGEVLRVNYRNRAEVLTFAQRFDAKNEVDDLDGEAGIALHDAEGASTGGTTAAWRGSEAELAEELPRRVAGLPAPLGQTALILFHRGDLTRCRRILRTAGIPCLSLDDYSGEPGDCLKVGTVHRAKGLDFQAVLVVEFPGKPTENGVAAEEAPELRDRQRLVAATRARDYLWWGVVEPAGEQVPDRAPTPPAADDSECVHQMPIAWCAHCRKPPADVLPHGYRTKGGNAYHNDPDCTWLDKGQRSSAHRGQTVHPKERIAWGAVTPGELEPCEACCTEAWLRRHGHR